MSRWIDADALKEDLLINHNTDLMSQSLVLGSGFDVGVDYVMQFIEDAPSIDLVRCAECKYCILDLVVERRASGYERKINLCRNPTHNIEWAVDKDWYCADGKRGRVGESHRPNDGKESN